MVVASTAGDLVESVFKHRMGVKGHIEYPARSRWHDGSPGLDSFRAAAAGFLIFRFLPALKLQAFIAYGGGRFFHGGRSAAFTITR